MFGAEQPMYEGYPPEHWHAETHILPSALCLNPSLQLAHLNISLELHPTPGIPFLHRHETVFWQPVRSLLSVYPLLQLEQESLRFPVQSEEGTPFGQTHALFLVHFLLSELN
jgi:hypothetical protein